MLNVFDAFFDSDVVGQKYPGERGPSKLYPLVEPYFIQVITIYGVGIKVSNTCMKAHILDCNILFGPVRVRSIG